MSKRRQHPRQMSILDGELRTRELEKAAHFDEQMRRVESGDVSLLDAFVECNRHDEQVDEQPLTTEGVRRKRKHA